MDATQLDSAALLRPVIALVALTGLVWLAMLFARNLAVMRGAATVGYYRGYTGQPPAEVIERPARAFMNLLELPVLFYLVCVLMIVTQRFDSLQVTLAWVFVACRVVHAAIHIGVNHVGYRLAAYVAGTVTLTILWVRFATQAL